MESSLNPEAPEFQPNLQTVALYGFRVVQKSIKSINHMPFGTSYRLYKTYCDFDSVTNQIIENVILLSNNILSTDFPKIKLKNNNNEANREQVVDVNDYILDRAQIILDNIKGENNISGNLTLINPLQSWNSPVITKIQSGSNVYIGAKNIMRPQLLFRDQIDNSERLWRPKIFEKPNSIAPLVLRILYNDRGKALGYEHPYKTELNSYNPPSQFLHADDDGPTFPAPLEQTKLIFIDKAEQVDSLVEHLNTVTEIAVDLEHHSIRTYQGFTCLIQMTTSGGDFIIDALAVREHLYKLNIPFTNPEILKVFHGAGCDILWLQRDFGVYVVGMFDTYYAARALNFRFLSLKYLLMTYCRVEADKQYQLADWRIRPLTDELIRYARTDTHYLLYIWHCLKRDLLAAGSGQNNILTSVFKNSQLLCGSTYHKASITDDSHIPLYIRSMKLFDFRQMEALRVLYKWRDTNARQLDDGPNYLMPERMLVALAEKLPLDVQGVIACCSPLTPFIKRNLLQLHQMIISCRELPLQSVLYPMPAPFSNNLQSSQPFPRVLDNANLFNSEPLAEAGVEGKLYHSPPNSPTKMDTQDDNQNQKNTFVSNLNVHAKLYVPPFDRYRSYRAVAWDVEMKQFQEKETKIAALGEGNELIKSEVLDKLQEANAIKEKQIKELGSVINTDNAVTNSDEEAANISNVEVDSEKSVQRKRKISNEKADKTKKSDVNQTTVTQKTNKNNEAPVVEPFNYKSANYKKFHSHTQRDHKNVMKFSKKRK